MTDTEASHQLHRKKAPASVCCAVLTISDTRSPTDDHSGKLIQSLLKKSGHQVMTCALVADEASAIESKLRMMLAASEIQAIIANGGTGIAPRDVTAQVVATFITKPLPGFGELFRMLSYQEVGAASMLSRALAGANDKKLLFALPGSLAAVRLAMKKLILPELAHTVYELNKSP